MPKNIVVFSDGTNQEGGKGNPSNVYKLFNMVEDRTEKQIAFYDRGLGTDWRRVTGNAFGAGISENILECYQFIFENYQAGDQIYLFGFSRGAFTVRSLSGFLHYFGILPKSRPELIKRAYDIYKNKNDEKRKKDANAFIEKHHTQWTKIKFIGVWDTVGALGMPIEWLDVGVNTLFKHEFHDTRISGAVEAGYHALSIDDDRLVFHPTLWDEENIGKISYWENGERKEKDQIVEQVWFVGAHTDIGGGFEPLAKGKSKAKASLSDIPFEWLLGKSEEHGLRIYPRHQINTNPDVLAKLHKARTGVGKAFKETSRSKTKGLDKLKYPLKVHKSVLERVEKDKNYRPWILDKEHTAV